MDWTKPLALEVNGPLTHQKRLVLYFGHYDLRLYMNDTAYIDVGAGSLELTATLANVPRHVGSIGTIGRFCETAPSAQIFVRGEHANDRPVNICFSGMPVVSDHFVEAAMRPLVPVRIGNGVLISASAKIMSGVEVGDGAVIGAAAVLTKPADPFGIYAGAPARKIRSREVSAPWWDFAPSFIAANQQRLQDLAARDVTGQEYRIERPRFVLRNENTGTGLDLAGFVVNDEVRPFTEAPEMVRWYVEQFMTSDKPLWLADCWA